MLIIPVTVLDWPLTATFDPIVIVPRVFAILNLVFVPVIYMEAMPVLTVPESALAVDVETVIIFEYILSYLLKSE